MDKEYKGYNGTVVLTDKGVIIKRGAKGFIFGGGSIRGDKTIPYSSIIAVQYKKPGVTVGYIQLTLKGGSDAKSGITEAIGDENTVTFASKKTGKLFWELKELIEKKADEAQSGHQVSGHNELNDLEKLAKFKEQGIITEEEFIAKKKQILGL